MIFNVRSTVVELVEANSPEDALVKVQIALARAGFENYDTDENDAFESEALTFECHVDQRGFVLCGPSPEPRWR